MQIGANIVAENQGSHGYPTVLVAVDDAETRRTLVDDLRQDDYNILEAPDVPSMVELVLTQSKPVHFLLIDLGTDKRSWALRLKNHKRDMVVLLVAEHPDGQSPDVLTPILALSAVRDFFNRSTGESTETQSASGQESKPRTIKQTAKLPVNNLHQTTFQYSSE